MTTRKYDFVTGIETSTAPTATDPVNPSDPVILDYAERHFVQGTETQATITALKALATADRFNGDIVFVKDHDVAFRYDSGSSATADDFFYLLPASGTGRWVRITEFDHATGDLTIPRDITVTRNAIITGDLTVNGTTTTINTATLDVEDPNINVNNGGTQATANSAGAGINVEMSDATHAALSYDSTLNSKWKAGNIGSQSEIITQANAQTFSAVKTFTASPNFNVASNYAELGSTPPTPAAGYRSIYPTSTGWKDLDSAGLVSDLGAGGGSGSGEVNAIADTDTASGTWAATGTITVATTTTSAEIPLYPTKASAIKISGGAAADYARYRFTMPAALLNRKLKFTWWQLALSSMASGEFKAEVWVNSASNYGGSYTEIPLESDASGNTLIPNINGRVDGINFDASTNLYYEIRFVRVTGTGVLALNDVLVGPGIMNSGYAGGLYEQVTTYIIGASTTPPTPGTGALYFRETYRDGSYAVVRWEYSQTGTGANGTGSYRLPLPTGLTVDTSRFGIAAGYATEAMFCSGHLRTTLDYFPSVLPVAADLNKVELILDDGTTTANSWGAGVGGLGSNAFLSYSITARIPIAEWAGGSGINLGANDIEYAATSGTWDADNSTTVFGPQGVEITGALTNTRIKTVTWQKPPQITDKIELEISSNRIQWMDANIFAPTAFNSTGDSSLSAGVGISNVTATTTLVQFYRYRVIANDDSPAFDWTAGYYWRVKKTRAGSAVGFGNAANGFSGLINYYNTESKSAVSGDFTSGTATYTRIGNVVTVNVSVLGHGSNGGPSTAAGFLPTWARPATTQRNVISTFISSYAVLFDVQADGSFLMRYYSANGTTSSQTSSLVAGSITFIV